MKYWGPHTSQFLRNWSWTFCQSHRIISGRKPEREMKRGWVFELLEPWIITCRSWLNVDLQVFSACWVTFKLQSSVTPRLFTEGTKCALKFPVRIEERRVNLTANLCDFTSIESICCRLTETRCVSSTIYVCDRLLHDWNCWLDFVGVMFL